MNTRAALLAGLFASVMATASCGESVFRVPAEPSGPSSLSDLLLPRLSGSWGGTLALTGIAGGTGPARAAGAVECVGAAFDEVVGEINDHTLSITQASSELTAKLVSTTTGLACDYKGRLGAGNTFVLHAERCTQVTLAFLCPDGRTRELDLVGSSVTATFDDPINPRTIQGTAAHTYNVEEGGNPLGALVANHSFPGLTRR